MLPEVFCRLAVGTALTLLICGNVTPQSVAQVNNATGKTVVVPAGTTFEGRIDQTIGSAHTRQGTRFLVTMASPALANGQDVLIPAGAAFMGEVVEAIPSSQVPHQKKMPHKPGKLRVEITGLRMPDGITYPLVASFVGEVMGKNSGGQGAPQLGGGVAYIGSQSGFNMVYPRAGGRGGPLVSKQQMMTNPLFGDAEKSGKGGSIRSLTTHNNDLLIHAGSPMSVRLDAPLRMALTPVPMPGIEPVDMTADPAGHRFSHEIPAGTMPQMPQSGAPPSAAGGAPGAAPAQAVRAAGDNTPSFLTPIPGATPPPAAMAPPVAPAAPAAAQAPAGAPPALSPVEMMLRNPGPAPFTKTSDLPPMQIDLDHGLNKPAGDRYTPATAQPADAAAPGGAMAQPLMQGMQAAPGGAMAQPLMQGMQAAPGGAMAQPVMQGTQAMPGVTVPLRPATQVPALSPTDAAPGSTF
jgi:hypothetical protein